jgi:predicted acyltransferase
VLRRAALIFVFGFLMYWFPFVHRVDGAWGLIPFADTRVMGVLQRIALCYALAAFAVRYLDPRGLLALSALLLLGYWGALLAFGDPADPFSKLGNAGTRLDLMVIGQAHLYRRDGGFDPEGLLGTLPATVNVIAGYLTARYLTQAPDRRRAALRMALAGAALMVIAFAWSPIFPIAKKLWTGSFVLLTVGSDLVVLAALIAVLGDRAANPAVRFFQVFGRNPLVIYLFSELFVVTLRQFEVAPGGDPYEWAGGLFQAIAPGALGSLLCAIAYMLTCWLLGYLMDRRGLVVKL